ncbi:hypothetical protein [Methylobacterium nigriterrae]|uniref:hypothetical protein n=1 Tax=Methylobacterium nigriterrae TaxID=3127512 RepID=UPI003013F059
MYELSRLRAALPYAAALYLLTSIAQLQATQPAHVSPGGLTADRVVRGLTWHMLQIARNEQGESLVFYPGN